MDTIPYMKLFTDKPNSEIKIAVAMSGGVDSSVVAGMIKEQGYQVVGVTLLLHPSHNNSECSTIKQSRTCCSEKDIFDARRVAQKLGIPHYVLNYEDQFREKVIKEFCKTYEKGKTPIPCILCNQHIKFDLLLNSLKELDCDLLVTGHYLKWLPPVENEDLPQILKGNDHKRDQSYFLYSTPREALNNIRFPLGDYTKDQTRELAKKYGLSVASKPDSQDICFVPNGDYATFVKNNSQTTFKAGDFIHIQTNKILCQHKGIIHYTVGQRKGLGIGGTKEPLYVIKIDAKTNTVYVGEKEFLQQDSVNIESINWLIDKNLIADNMQVQVKLRSTQTPLPATLKIISDDKIQVQLLTSDHAVSPGQACVFYQKERMLGGGIIQ